MDPQMFKAHIPWFGHPANFQNISERFLSIFINWRFSVFIGQRNETKQIENSDDRQESLLFEFNWRKILKPFWQVWAYRLRMFRRNVVIFSAYTVYEEIFLYSLLPGRLGGVSRWINDPVELGSDPAVNWYFLLFSFLLLFYFTVIFPLRGTTKLLSFPFKMLSSAVSGKPA